MAGPYPLAPYYGPDLLQRLHAYHKARAAALLARAQFTSFLAGVNTVLVSYEHLFPELRKALLRTQQQIREYRHGYMAPDQEGRAFTNVSDVSADGQSSRRADTNRYECRRFFKTLAQIYHPDKGGDPEMFQALRTARDQGDIDFLRVQWVISVKARNFSWILGEGLQFWSVQAEKATVNRKQLRSLPIFKVVSAHVAGSPDLAKQRMDTELQNRLAVLKAELSYARLRSRGEHLDVDEYFKPASQEVPT